MIEGGSRPKNCPKSSIVYMVENLFTNLKLFTECKNNRVWRICGRSREDRYAPKWDFPFIKLEGKMPLFELKCALNQPKMVQNTWNLHQSSISVSTFRKYEQKIVAIKNLAAATDFPFKIPRIPFTKGKIPLSAKSRKKFQLFATSS